MAINIERADTLTDLIEKLRTSEIKRVLLTSYGSVEPVKEGPAFVLAGMTTVAATALDTSKSLIHRWQKTERSKGTVTINAPTGRGQVAPSEPAARLREDVFSLLREEGFEVDEGEWTPASAQRFIDSRQRLIG